MEIISPESIERDRETKFNEYQTGGVSEYWLIDPLENEAIFYQLNSQGQYEAKEPDEYGRYYSRAIPGFWLHPSWFWQFPMPQTDEILLEINKEAYFRRQMQLFRDNGLLPPES